MLISPSGLSDFPVFADKFYRLLLNGSSRPSAIPIGPFGNEIAIAVVLRRCKRQDPSTMERCGYVRTRDTHRRAHPGRIIPGAGKIKRSPCPNEMSIQRAKKEIGVAVTFVHNLRDMYRSIWAWANTEHILIGGGFRRSRLGELALSIWRHRGCSKPKTRSWQTERWGTPAVGLNNVSERLIRSALSVGRRLFVGTSRERAIRSSCGHRLASR